VTWLAWRQFRAQAVLGIAFAVAVAGVLLVTRDHVAHAGDPDLLSTTYKQLRLLGTVLIGVPAFIGAFWGAPMLAREYEAGTYRLAWTQSITRRRWLATKVAVVSLVTVAVTALFTTLFTWWSLPFDRTGNRIGTANFGQRGIAPIAYALFALALGVFLGTVIRRTVPAIASTLLGFFVFRFLFQLLVRSHLLHASVVRGPTTLFAPREAPTSTSGGWIFSTKSVDAAGHPLVNGQADRLVAASCHVTADTTGAALNRCADRIGIHDVVRMIPADRFWTLQLLEAGCFLLAGAVLVGLTFWQLGRRRA
jgi:hypothetical protein